MTEADHDRGRGTDRGPTGGPSRWVLVVGVLVAAALLGLIVFLHLSGTIGPGVH